jgi:hypothetical protein
MDLGRVLEGRRIDAGVDGYAESAIGADRQKVRLVQANQPHSVT